MDRRRRERQGSPSRVVTGVIMLKLRVCVGAALAVVITSVEPVSAQRVASKLELLRASCRHVLAMLWDHD
jgi:hypothetical protein